jgi:hypothetical protein
LFVAKIVPLSPTAQHADVVGHDTPRSALVVPDASELHVLPPFVVARIVPPSPTAQQALADAHDAARRELVVPDAWTVHVVARVVGTTTSIAERTPA